MEAQLERIFAETGASGETRRNRAKYVLPLLQRIQQEFGYIPREAFHPVAKFAGVPESHVYGVATFYAQFKLSPVGKNVITVCRGTACHVRRSASLLDDLRQRLGIEPGETTQDMKFTLQTVACMGSCALAPVMVVNGKVYGQMNRSKMLKLLNKLAQETEDEKPAEVAS